MTTITSPDTELAAALRRARRRGVNKADLCAKLGIREIDLDKYASGERTPAPWIAREVAATVGRSAAALFPRLTEQQARQPVHTGRGAVYVPGVVTTTARSELPRPELPRSKVTVTKCPE